MLVSEIPSTAKEIATGEWSDSTTKKKYFLDPKNNSLIVERSWTADEIAEENQSVATYRANTDNLNDQLLQAIENLKTDIGPSTTTVVPGFTSLNAIAKEANANIDASPAKYIKFIARALRTTNRALIANSKVQLGAVQDINIGE